MTTRKGKFHRLKSSISSTYVSSTTFTTSCRVVFIYCALGKALKYSEYRKDDLHLPRRDVMTFFGGNLNALWYAILFLQKPDITVQIIQVPMNVKIHC